MLNDSGPLSLMIADRTTTGGVATATIVSIAVETEGKDRVEFTLRALAKLATCAPALRRLTR